MVKSGPSGKILDLETTARAIDEIRDIGMVLCFEVSLSLDKSQLLELQNLISKKFEYIIEKTEKEYFSRFFGVKTGALSHNPYGVHPKRLYLYDELRARYDGVSIYSTFDKKSSSDIVKLGFLRAYELIEYFDFLYPDLVSLTKPSYPPRGIWKRQYILSVEDIRNHPQIRECNKRLDIVNKYYPKLIDLLKKL